MTTILHIITGLGVGGAERALYTLLAGGLQGRYCNIVVSLTDEGHYGQKLRKIGVPVYCLGLKRGRFSLTALSELRSIVIKEHPLLIQGWMYHGNIAATLVHLLGKNHGALSWNIRTSLDSMVDMSRSTRFIIALGRLLSNRPNAIIFNSVRSSQQHVTKGYCKSGVTVIPNGFDTSIWAPSSIDREAMRSQLGYDQKDFILGYVGRNNVMKDPENLFEALKIVLLMDTIIKIVIVGNELEAAAPQEIRESIQVQFLGKRSDVPKLMCMFDVLCLSSRVEGFPNVIGEAMATGVPCVSTNVGDVANILGQQGWLVPVRNPQALAAAIFEARSKSQSELRESGRKSRDSVKANYSHTAIIERYIDLYSMIISERKSSTHG
ncbi:glycosyltransferase (plasmid) [Rhodobacteraceae bacterium S2214]|nr:glycosyltransferase [Rhodobacteraceae bacterium S2214]